MFCGKPTGGSSLIVRRILLILFRMSSWFSSNCGCFPNVMTRHFWQKECPHSIILKSVSSENAAQRMTIKNSPARIPHGVVTNTTLGRFFYTRRYLDQYYNADSLTEDVWRTRVKSLSFKACNISNSRVCLSIVALASSKVSLAVLFFCKGGKEIRQIHARKDDVTGCYRFKVHVSCQRADTGVIFGEELTLWSLDTVCLRLAISSLILEGRSRCLWVVSVSETRSMTTREPRFDGLVGFLRFVRRDSLQYQYVAFESHLKRCTLIQGSG